MKFVTETLPLPTSSSINALVDFKNPLHELETYVTNSQNPKLADSFLKFKEALSESNHTSAETLETHVPAASILNTKPQPEERSYLAMSSLFSANVKHW